MFTQVLYIHKGCTAHTFAFVNLHKVGNRCSTNNTNIQTPPRLLPVCAHPKLH